MEEKENIREIDAGMGERLLREILRTPPLKEAILLSMKDIEPGTAPGLARAVLWEDPVVFMSVFGALPNAVNWLLEFLLELGKQFNGLPGPLLKDFISVIRTRVDLETLGKLPEVYGELLKRLFLEDEELAGKVVSAAVRGANAAIARADRATAGLEKNPGTVAEALARGLGDLDRRTLGRVMRRLAAVARETVRLKAASRRRGAFPAVLAAFGALLVVWRLVRRMRG